VPSPELQLYIDADFFSPYAFSAFVAVSEKGLPFELRPLNLAAGENLAAGFAELSLTRRIPTLVHGDFSLSESSAIAEYLDEVFPTPPIYPREPRARARARQVQAWLRTDLLPLREERSTEDVFIGPTEVPLGTRAQAAVARLLAVAEALLPPGGRHLFGEWSIADADLALMLNRLVRNGDPVPARIADYARGQWQRPSIQSWVERFRQAHAQG
jgi:glutathione S-transferase